MTRKGREIPPVQRWLKFSAVGAIGILVQLGSLFVLTAGLDAGLFARYRAGGRGGGAAQLCMA